jgi:hypothetical protein
LTIDGCAQTRRTSEAFSAAFGGAGAGRD